MNKDHSSSSAAPNLDESTSAASADRNVSHPSRILSDVDLRPLARALIELAIQIRTEEIEKETEEAAA